MSQIHRFEERHPSREQFLVVGVCAPQALDQRAKQRRVRAPVFAVLQVKVVHEFAEISQARVRQAETRAQHFEGARIALVGEVTFKHVERQGAGPVTRASRAESECGVRVDEATD